MSSAPQKAVVERRYEVQEKPCAQALKLLLHKAAGVSSTNGDEEKGFQHDLPAPRILHH
jgi:hypothetical protein